MLVTSTGDSPSLGECHREHRALARLQNPAHPGPSAPHCTSSLEEQPEDLHQLPAKLTLIEISECPRQLGILIKTFIFVR